MIAQLLLHTIRTYLPGYRWISLQEFLEYHHRIAAVDVSEGDSGNIMTLLEEPFAFLITHSNRALRNPSTELSGPSFGLINEPLTDALASYFWRD